MTPDWSAVRAEFPALANWTYLNSATFGQLPKRGVAAVNQHWAHRDELACSDFLDWYSDADRLRVAVAGLIHCSADDIAFIPHAAAGLGVITSGIDWKRGDNVVTLTDEFPNYLYLSSLSDQYGIEFREVPWSKFYDSIDDRTRLVAVSEVNYATGFRVPVADVSPYLRERNVTFFVDGTQSLGALEFDIRRIQPDVLAVHGYKWMISPTGAGFMYVAPHVRERIRPNAVGWRSHKTWRGVDNLHHGTPEFMATAEKYEGGGLPFPLLYAMEASVNLMLEIGPEVIEQRVLGLAQSARERLRALGATALDTGSQIVAAKFPGQDVSRIARELKDRRVLVAARHGHLRVAPHFYNDESDLDRLVEELKRLL